MTLQREMDTRVREEAPTPARRVARYAWVAWIVVAILLAAVAIAVAVHDSEVSASVPAPTDTDRFAYFVDDAGPAVTADGAEFAWFVEDYIPVD